MKCSIWNLKIGKWQSDGCEFYQLENSLGKCVCDHGGIIAIRAVLNEVIFKEIENIYCYELKFSFIEILKGNKY